jgi:hypothetical protein
MTLLLLAIGIISTAIIVDRAPKYGSILLLIIIAGMLLTAKQKGVIS